MSNMERRKKKKMTLNEFSFSSALIAILHIEDLVRYNGKGLLFRTLAHGKKCIPYEEKGRHPSVSCKIHSLSFFTYYCPLNSNIPFGRSGFSFLPLILYYINCNTQSD